MARTYWQNSQGSWLLAPILGIAGSGGVPGQSMAQLDDAHLAFGVVPIMACILTLIWMYFDDSQRMLGHRFSGLGSLRR